MVGSRLNIGLEISRAIRGRCDWYHNKLIPEAPVNCPVTRTLFAGTKSEQTYESFDTYFADYISVSVAGYATELEVKVSRADWREDLKKWKWSGRLPAYISRFIYVVPEELGIPEWVNPMAGVWHVRAGGTRKHPMHHIVVARNPRRIGKEKVPEKVLARWLEAFYYRYWRLHIDVTGQRIHDKQERTLRHETDDPVASNEELA